MFFMRRKPKFNQQERDAMLAFISRPTGKTSDAVRLIKAVERPGMGVPCPAYAPHNRHNSYNEPYVS
jgi:hypothetical protein